MEPGIYYVVESNAIVALESTYSGRLWSFHAGFTLTVPDGQMQDTLIWIGAL